MKKRGRHSSDKREEERGKRKEVASLACTHEGGAKLLQLLPAAASSLQIWGAQLAGGLPPNHAEVRALEQSPKIDTAFSVPQSHTSSSPIHPKTLQASKQAALAPPTTPPLHWWRRDGRGWTDPSSHLPPNPIPTTDIQSLYLYVYV